MRKLPQWGPWQSPGRKRILAYFEGHKTLHFIWQNMRGWICISVHLLQVLERETCPSSSPVIYAHVRGGGIHFEGVTSMIWKQSVNTIPVSQCSLQLVCHVAENEQYMRVRLIANRDVLTRRDDREHLSVEFYERYSYDDWWSYRTCPAIVTEKRTCWCVNDLPQPATTSPNYVVPYCRLQLICWLTSNVNISKGKCLLYCQLCWAKRVLS